jgi:HSP20 family protein
LRANFSIEIKLAQGLIVADEKKEVTMANIMKRNSGNGSALTTTSPAMTFGGLVDSVLEKSLNRFFDDDFWGFNGMLTSSQVPVNIRETDNSYEMDVVAPGLKKEDFNFNVNDKTLTISFEHKEENKDENKRNGYLRQEYRSLSFSRSFTLNDTINAEQIVAHYKDGVLHLTLPKKEGAQKITKNIEVK